MEQWLNELTLSGAWSFNPDRPLALREMSAVNLIIGPNNAGKTNICRALRAVRSALPVDNEDSTAVHRLLDEPPFVGRTDAPFCVGLRWRSPPCAPVCLVSSLDMTMPRDESSPSRAASWSNPGESGIRELLGWLKMSLFTLIDGELQIAEALEVSPASMDHAWGAFQQDLDAIRTPVQQWLTAVVGEPLSLEVDLKGDSIEISASVSENLGVSLGVRLMRSGNWTHHPIAAVGAGVPAILPIVVQRMALRHRERGRLIILDEPYSHLHPGAACELVRGWRRFFPADQLIVTAHDTALVDAAQSDWTIFRVTNDGEGSQAARVQTDRDRLALMGELGVRPSQLFLAASVIWVEGPSDAIYLRRALADRGLVEGRDFTFVIYGGALGQFVRVGSRNRNRVVELMRVAPNPVFVCDRDAAGSRSPKKRWARELIAEAKSELAGEVVFPTPGREIENTVQSDLLVGAVRSMVTVAKRGKHLRPLRLNVDVRADDSFDKAISQSAVWDDTGRRLSAKARTTLRTRLERKKFDIASELACLTESPFRTDQSVESFFTSLSCSVRAARGW